MKLFYDGFLGPNRLILAHALEAAQAFDLELGRLNLGQAARRRRTHGFGPSSDTTKIFIAVRSCRRLQAASRGLGRVRRIRLLQFCFEAEVWRLDQKIATLPEPNA